MSWENDLQDASFRGVKFDVINLRDSEQRALAQHEYPFLDGADIQDLGSLPHSVQLQAVFWGDDYNSRLQTFMEALRKQGAAELIHPVFGSMPTMQVNTWQVNHDAENVDYCTIDIQFFQSKTGNPFFVTDFPLSKADTIFNQIQSLIASANTLMEDVTRPLRTAKSWMKKIKGLATAGLNLVTIFRSEISGFISSTSDFINFPSAFFSDLRSALSLKTGASKSSLHSTYTTPTSQTASASSSSASTSATTSTAAVNYTSSPAVVMADWSNTHSALSNVAAMPAGMFNGSVETAVDMPAGLTENDIIEHTATVSIAVAIESAEECSAVLSDATITAVLTPDDVEKITNDTRQLIQTAIDTNRAAYTSAMSDISSSATPIGLSYLPVINQLEDIALAVQDLGYAVIQEKPQLVKKTVAYATNLHLAAHHWYGDYTRAEELARLNPQIRDPNNLQMGDVLNAYSE
ncbi:DNA circularization protein [Lonsdalea britannica]|uniref:DNA circularization protein n=1 Tax=Lonsdalea britannica TaxID=1082704 RepID=UPI0026EC61BD|nr:DNA circularization N-terminal domain-containing protein [Lonsdalea britannica]